MWTLQENSSIPDKVHYLPCGSRLIVSRREGHILLQGDNSISRQHAALFINHPPLNLKNVQALPQVTLTELGAKYGTFVNEGIQNDRRIQDKSEVKLMNNDMVRFGMLTNTWRLVYRSLVVTTSTLQPDSKIELTNALLKLGGHLVGEWCASCSYLVMNNITLTVKVVCALAVGCRIVTPEFFTKFSDAVINKSPHPNPAEFQPPLKEMSINGAQVSFSPNKERKVIFNGKTFLFHSARQLKRMRQAISLAGGSAEELTQDNYKMLTSGNYLLVQITSERNQGSQNNTLFDIAYELLQTNGLRAIPESDIGLAVLYVSTEGHCNPAFKVSSILRRTGSTTSQMTEGLKIYATETQEMEESSMSLTGTRAVPETGLSSTSKRTSPAVMSSTSPPVPNSISSATNTCNSTLLPTSLNQSLTSKSKNEDKENLSKNTRKRPHTVSGEAGSPLPLPKRSNKLQLGQTHQDPPDPTQPIDSQMECNDSQPSGLKFKPEVFSTQKENTTLPVTSVDVHPSKPVSSEGREAVTGTPVATSVSSNQTIDHTVGRSIPFEPYTLPSLKTETLEEDDTLTQPFVPVKRESACYEGDDSVLEVTDCYRGKRRREEQVELVNDEDEGLWHDSKKTRIGNVNMRLTKAERISGVASAFDQVDQRPKNSTNEIKQEKVDEGDLFAVPTSVVRSQRRADDKSTALENRRNMNLDAEESSADSDPFALPLSARSDRRKRHFEMKSEMAKVPKESREKSDQGTTVSNINTSETGLQKSRQNLIIASEGSFVSKKTCNIKRSPSELEAAAPTGAPPQLTAKLGDTADLNGLMEKSLVIVEVASLIKQINNRTAAEASHNQNSGGLPNYKRFRKSACDIISLPRIIGGRELVPHDVAENPHRDAWFMENRDVTRMLDERQAQEHTGRSNDDELFDLPMLTKNRVRKPR